MAAVDTVWDTLAANHNSTVGESSEELAQTPTCSPIRSHDSVCSHYQFPVPAVVLQVAVVH